MNYETLLSFIRHVGHAYASYSQDVLGDISLNRTALSILLFLSENPDGCTARDISKTKNIKANVISMNVDKLVQDGYLERQSVEGDRRKVKLVCTKKAYPLIEQGLKMRNDFETFMREGISPEDSEVLNRCLCTIKNNAKNLTDNSQRQLH